MSEPTVTISREDASEAVRALLAKASAAVEVAQRAEALIWGHAADGMDPVYEYANYLQQTAGRIQQAMGAPR